MHTNIVNLQARIKHLNATYRVGQPEVSDEQYDNLLDQLRGVVPADEFALFLRGLTEPGGDVKHPYTVGSLKKVKFGENQLAPWINRYVRKLLFAMPKLDGLTFVARYIDGVLTTGSTKGDGATGKNISEKLAWILPTKLDSPVTMDIRGELTLTGDDHIALGFKNRRNGTVGLINRDNAGIDEIQKIKAFTYQIKAGDGSSLPLPVQLKTLQDLGLAVVPWTHFDLAHISDPEQVLATQLCTWKEQAPCDLDGLVLCDADYVPEDEFLPEGIVAFKVNQDAITTTVTGIEWNVSKNGLIKPVLLVEPKEICGTTVSRVTGNNARWLLDNGVGEGAVIGIIKSGEIVPKCVEVYQTAPVVFLGECPSCGTSLDLIGVDLCCDNEACGAAGVKTVESFLSKLDIEGAKATTLENLGIRSMEDLLTWTPDANYKSQRSLWFEIEKKVFNAPADRLFAAMLFDGFGQKMIGRLVDYYGSRLAATGAIRSAAEGKEPAGGYPEGFTPLNMGKAAASWEANLEILGRICADRRYQEPAEEEKRQAGEGALAGKSFLFTGTMSMPRKQAEKLVTDNGGTIASGVSKSLAYLVAGESAGSKLDKANKLGVIVLTEEEFKGMLYAA